MKKQLLLFTTAMAMFFSHASQAQCTFTLEADKTVCVYPGYSDSVDVQYTVTGGTSGSVSWTTSGTGHFSPYYGQAYKYSGADLATGSVILTATLHGGSCDGLTDQITVTFIGVTAGADHTVCDDTLDLSGTATSGYTFQWYTLAGSGTFNNNALLNTAYIPSADDINRGFVLIGLKLTNNPSCLKEDTMRIDITPVLLPHTILNRTSCGNTVKVDGYIQHSTSYYWTTSGTGSISDASNDTIDYTPSAADLQSGSVTLTFTGTKAGCTSASTSTNITYVSSAAANAGPDETVCGKGLYLNGSVNGATSGVWTSSGTGSFMYNKAYLYNFYTFSAADKSAGSVTFTLTTTGNGTCTAVSDQKTVTILPSSSVTVNAGPDQVSTGTINLNGSVTGSASAVWSTSGNGTFAPSASALNAVYTPSTADVTAGYVVLTLASDNGVCGVQSDQMYAILENTSVLSGKITAGGIPLDKGVVWLFLKTGNNLHGFRLDTITTADNGNYSFSDLPDGTYYLFAAISSASAYAASYVPTYYGHTQSWTDGSPLNLTHSSYTGKDIPLLPFTSAQPNWNTGNDTIAGLVFQKPLSGAASRLIESGDEAVAGATVYLKKPSGETIAYTTTDAAGSYAFKKIVSGNYLIQIDYPGTVLTGSPLIIAVDGNAATIESGTIVADRQTLATGILSPSGNRSLTAYPNPATDYVQIPLITSAASCLIQITDASGTVRATYQQTIPDHTVLRIPVNILDAGLYLIQVTVDGTTYVSKIVK